MRIKRLLTIFLAGILFLMTMTGCQGGTAGPESEDTSKEASKTQENEEIDIFAVDQPMKESPVYTFDHEPTIEELRLTAVRAMRDMLSVEWYTPTTFTYEKTGAASDKLYEFKQYNRYAGLPYTNVNVSLYGFLEYYNQTTGRLLTEAIESTQFASLGQAVNQTIGNSCTGSADWALFSVCNSIRGNMVSYTQTRANGFLPVGDYTYDFSVKEFAVPGTNAVLTTDICNETGRERMYECYALVEAADLVVMQDTDRSKGHTMMAIEKATVVRNADGSINDAKSYIKIQDQRPGFYKEKDTTSDVIYNYSGRVSYDATFQELFGEGYIPVTTAEFIGEKAYEEGYVKLSSDSEVRSPEDLKTLALNANYPMTVLKLVATAQDGERTTLNSHIFCRNEVNNQTAFFFSLSGFANILNKENTLPKGEYTVTLEARISTGEVFVPVTFAYTSK